MVHATQIPLIDLNEEISINTLNVQGEFPKWLSGTLIRNGPAKFHFGDKNIMHWFDGLAMLHAFTFADGKISYKNKFLRTSIYNQTMKGHDLRFMGFAEDPCNSIFKRLFTLFFPSLTPNIIQNANVSITRIAEEYVALTETPLPVRFCPKSLETLGELNFQDDLKRKFCFESAHPHHDPLTNEIINFQMDLGMDCTYKIYSVRDKGQPSREVFFSLKTDRGAYMHTFALTENYVVLVEFPLVLKPLDLLLKGGGFITQFKWMPERNTRFHVIHRKEGKLVKSFETESFFCFHHVNAFEEKNCIVLDLVKYPNPQIVFKEAPKNQVRTLERFSLDLSLKKIEQHTIADSLLELPRINYQKYNGRFYHFVYGVGFKYPENEHDSIPIIKINSQTGNVLTWNEKGALCGEPVFISVPKSTKEDEGILLSVVINPGKKNSFLLALDAKNLQEIARAEVSCLIPYGLHGMFFH